ncbi:MAG: AhpC/TSA family protein [Pedobacter sp.]|nr:MAG: AhpC/TSA family protein [Pedobacter sp.]
MKIIKSIILGALVASPFFGMAQGDAYIIQGKVNPIYNGKFIKLIYTPEKAKKQMDSVQIAKGAFVFKGDVDRPFGAKLSMGNDESGDRIDLFISAGEIRVATKDSLRYAKITGNKITESYEKLAQGGLRSLEYNVIEVVNVFKAMPEGPQKKDYTKKLLEEFENYSSQKRKFVNQFIKENPDSYVSLYQLTKSAPDNLLNYETSFPYYDRLSQTVKDSPLGKEFGQKLMASKGTLTGENYKDFVSTTPDGKQLSLKEIVGSNKYTLVDFWASWCGPCRKENPYVVKTFDAFKEKGFTVLSVSLDDNAEKWNQAIKLDGMPWHHVSSLKGWKEPAAALYKVSAIPMNLLVDSEGKVVATNLRGEALYEKMETLLK